MQNWDSKDHQAAEEGISEFRLSAEWSGIQELRSTASYAGQLEAKGFMQGNDLAACLWSMDLQLVHAIDGQDSEVLSELPFIKMYAKNAESILQLSEFADAKKQLEFAIKALEETTRHTDVPTRDVIIEQSREALRTACQRISDGIDAVLYNGVGTAQQTEREAARSHSVDQVVQRLLSNYSCRGGAEPMARAIRSIYSGLCDIQTGNNIQPPSGAYESHIFLQEADRYFDSLQGYQVQWSHENMALRRCGELLYEAHHHLLRGEASFGREALFKAVKAVALV